MTKSGRAFLDWRVSSLLTALFSSKGGISLKSHRRATLVHRIPFSQAFAATLASGDDEIPVLLMHLPNWQTKAGRAAYAVTLLGLKSVVLNQPVLDCLNFEGGAEAVVANYGPSQLVVVEFTTPQFSVDNDQRIWTRIAELKNAGQAVPSAYRRVGNYSVFVFNATD